MTPTGWKTRTLQKATKPTVLAVKEQKPGAVARRPDRTACWTNLDKVGGSPLNLATVCLIT